MYISGLCLQKNSRYRFTCYFYIEKNEYYLRTGLSLFP